LQESKVFSHFSAPLLFALDRSQIFCIDVDTQQASVVLSKQLPESGQPNKSIFQVECSDSVYSEQKFLSVVGAVIQEVVIYIRQPKNKRLELRARQAGVGIKLDNGQQLVLSCGLHDGSDDFSVLFVDDIPVDLQKAMEEHHIHSL
ncbi:MAG: hypothetical protein AAFV25_03590, partial [Bacteroidota bacterium]